MSKQSSKFKKVIKKIVAHPEFKSLVDSFLSGFSIVFFGQLALLPNMDTSVMLETGALAGFMYAAVRAGFKAGTRSLFSYIVNKIAEK